MTPPLAASAGPRTAEVTAVGVSATDPRRLRIRPESGDEDAPAYLAAGLALTLGVGARVYYEAIGRRLVVRGGV